MHEMFSIYIENRHRMSCIELYIEFEQSEADRNIELEDYDSDSEEEFESHYEIVGLGEEEDEADGTINADVAEVANVLTNQQPFQEPSFMRSLDLEAMHALEFPQYMNAAELPVVMDGEFTVGMEFSSREAKVVESIFEGWEVSYEALPIWFEAMCHNEPSAVVHFETMPAYQGDDLVPDIRVLHRVFWSYYSCIRAFRHCKPVVQSTRVALHNDLFKCARHAEPQLYCMIPAKSRSKGRNFQCTAAPDLSPNRIVPNNNIM
ncbi:hypothetical protein Ahy_B03g066271 [Arachis hypogaea]|uniref:Uncharacterized protein n=1 Tax=Arachis hypogaea TaxID=3818 RepID=A0A445A3L0_ARAHY|nr:hypothetical protein Ahy_B03g066271 [Arachis hypogaea]